MGPLEVLKFTFFMAPGFNVWLFMLSPFTLILPLDVLTVVSYSSKFPTMLTSISPLEVLSETSSEIRLIASILPFEEVATNLVVVTLSR